MLLRCSKIAITGLLLVSTIVVHVQLDGVLGVIKELAFGSNQIVDRLHLAHQNPNVVDNFGVGIRQAEASTDYHDEQFHLTVGPITGSTTANYVYASLFNPGGSGKTITIKRLMVRANAVAAANYINLSVRRITTASNGTQIAATDIPHKNTESTDSVAEIRNTGPTVSFAGTTDSRLLGQPMPGAAGNEYSYREIVFSGTDESIVLQEGEGLAVYQEAAGDVDERVQATFEWSEVDSVPTAQNEYLMALPRVENAAGVNYVYNSFFNPATSSKSAIVKRIWYGSESCDAAAVYTNNIVIRRISAASAGTLVSAANIPKKNTSSSDSVMNVRHTGVTVTATGGTDARLLNVTPCGTTGEHQGWMTLATRSEDEQIVLKPGEGIALMSDTAGNANQLTRMFVEWAEVSLTNTPTAEGEYLWSSSRVEVAAALGTTFYTAFNPASSGKTATIKRIVLRVNADAAAAYSTFNVQRISTSTTGTLVTATDIPKKHSSSSNSIMQLRWCGAACATTITTTYVGGRSITAAGSSESGIMKVLGPGAVGQVHGDNEIILMPNEPLVLRAGEGIGVYLNYLAGNANHYIKVSIEWGESASAPTTANRYVIDIGALPGSTGVSNNYATFFNPSTSSKTAIIKQMGVRVNAIGAATYTPVQVKRISAASAGTLIAAANVPKKDTNATNSAMQIRYTTVTATYSQSVDAQLLAVQTPGAVASAAALGQTGWDQISFENNESIILQPGEGIVLNNNAAASANHRVYWYLEWEEVASTSTPVTESQHMMSIGPVTGSLTAGYVYATLFNPATSSQLYVVSRVGIRTNRTGTLTAPGYLNLSLRRITSASGGTLITTANIPEQHSSTTLTNAEVRTGGITVIYPTATSSRLFSAISPGAIQQTIGINEKEFVSTEEFVLFPGEGVALYQETNAGDTGVRYYMTTEWQEVALPAAPPSITMSLSDNSVGFGSLSSLSSRYATGDSLGSSTLYTAAHTISAATNATGGYVITVSGTTLTADAATVTPIGATALSPSIGAEQFGIAVSTATGTGVAVAPYATTNQYAFATSSFPDTIATGAGDEILSDFNVSYVANIGASTEAGEYSSQVTFTVTGTF